MPMTNSITCHVVALALSYACVSGTNALAQSIEPAATGSVDQTAPKDMDPTKALCALIETAAEENDLPIGFFTRLLWKESRFRSDAVSPKGAQGIAQFMPGTAAERGLADPFDSDAAIPASASLLADLAGRFGSLGLAAAAYNAGSERVRAWLSNGGTLPFETQDYVLSITGLPAATWADREPVAATAGLTGEQDCIKLVSLLGTPAASISPEIEIQTATAPWGVQVAGNFSRTRVVAAYVSLQKRFPDLLAQRPPMIVAGAMSGRGPRSFYRARVPVETKAEGEELCSELKRNGGSCIVLKS
jgi:hypothetical protein